MPGSVLASPVSAHYDPEPDYFFHWLRDSAVVMGAVVELIADGTLGAEGHAIIADFVRFSLALDALDGRRLAGRDYGSGVLPDVQRYLRPRAEMAAIHGDRIRMEARFNPDGSLDILRWARPQFDGPALRSLVLMRYARRYGASGGISALIDADLDFTLRYGGAEGYDIWEERHGADYYTRSLQQQALAEAAVAGGDSERRAAFGAAAARLAGLLDEHWSAVHGAYLSAVGGAAATSDRDVDFAVVLAALHSARDGGRHSVLDPRMQASLATLVEIFAGEYAINRSRPRAAPALGRYRGDVYQSGGAYYFSTLGAAEFHYRLAAAAAGQGLETGPENARFLAQTGLAAGQRRKRAMAAALIRRGDRFMATVRRFTPASGALSEQFDRTDGRQTSARHLAWSYAAFISAVAARRRAQTALA